MSERAPYNEIDSYIATFTQQERDELAAAEAALDLAVLLHKARETQGLSQAGAAQLAGLQQQAVRWLEQPGANVEIATIQRYLAALGYTLELAVRETKTGKVLGSATLATVIR